MAEKSLDFKTANIFHSLQRRLHLKLLNVLNGPFPATAELGEDFFCSNIDTCQINELNLNGLNFVSWQPESQESAPLSLEEERAFQYL